MRGILIGLSLLLQVHTLSSQKLEQGFDIYFKPTEYVPRFYVVTEKKDALWHREAWYLPESGMAMEGWFKDKNCTIAQGSVSWYHPNKVLKSTGAYVNGEKEGTWLEYGEEGALRDSAYYVAGRLKGIRLLWNTEGIQTDSMQFDGSGNGAEVSWYENGTVSAAGYWISDTIKRGRWKYYHLNGKIRATEDYINGERISCNCFDEGGRQMDSLACLDREAEFAGGPAKWLRFLEKNLNPYVPLNKKAPSGEYTVMLQFVVNSDGSINQIKALTRFGYGMEEEVERLLKQSPRCVPALQFGHKVKAYRKQPVTFVVSN